MFNNGKLRHLLKNFLIQSYSANSSFRRCFHTQGKLYLKINYEKENQYAYNILLRHGYTENFYENGEVALTKIEFEKLLQQDWFKCSPHDLFKVFPKMGLYCTQNHICISNQIFDKYIDNLTDNLQHASDTDLKLIFHALKKWPETQSIRTRNFIEVWVALDEECTNRLKNWCFEEILLFISLFYSLGVLKSSDFCTKSINKLATKSKNLSPGQLVQTLFYVSVLRKAPFDMHNFEVQLCDNFPQFSLDDLAVISMGFFKSKTCIRDAEIIAKIIDKIIENSNEIHEVSLAALLKIIRYSLKFDTTGIIYKLLDSLVHQIDRVSIMCNVHIALVGTATLTYHEKCLHKIANVLAGSLKSARLKDIERIILTFGLFNYYPSTKTDFLKDVISELRSTERNIEFSNHGRSFANCVAYLGLFGVYPEDLINRVLNKEFLEATYGKHCITYGREILTLNNVSQIFLTDLTSCLAEHEVKILAKKYTDYMPSENFKKEYNKAEKMIIDIVRVLKDNLGEENVIGGHILTHHQRGDIIMCYNEAGKSLPVSNHFSNENFGFVIKPPDKNKWVALVVAGRNAIIRNKNTPTGPFLTKLRELNKLGYHSSLVLWNVYSNLETSQDKFNYLKCLINDALSEKNVDIETTQILQCN